LGERAGRFDGASVLPVIGGIAPTARG